MHHVSYQGRGEGGGGGGVPVAAVVAYIVSCPASLAKLKPTRSNKLKQVYLEHHYLLPYCILPSQFKILLQQLGSNQSKVEIENEVFDELMYEEENPKRSISFGFNVDQSDVFGVNSILKNSGYVFPDNNMELKCVKEELASLKAMFLLMLKAERNGKITNEFLDATEVQEESSGNDLSNESTDTGPSTSTSQVN
ncbi:hypothetical protein Cgig2_011798 [Carnegiea gigantea]|uniref:Uncharacterized protein n=1 Tax=Carnegiea gigantea TaxID=171969 RepID=A0A9Q1JJC3_9CARY|nr:hypothetical protein Cgig2_011798 [Carnegiea gigantea]